MSTMPAPTHSERQFTLGLLALDGAMLSSLAGPTDMLRVAQKLAELRDPATPLRFRTSIVTARGMDALRCSGGLRIEGVVCEPSDPDVLLVPGSMHGSGSELIGRMQQLQPEIDLLNAMFRRGVKLASSCSGAFLLAEAGLLDGRRATTAWWLDSVFRERYPRVQLDIERMIVEDGPITTCGATSSVMSYVLKLIARVGGEDLAQQTARILLIDPDRQSQAPYISQALKEKPRHSLGERIEHILNKNLHESLSVSHLAEQVGVSERSLLRHFKAQLGSTPLEHIQHLRAQRAKALLETTHLSFDEIVERCGYSDSSSFRKLFKRATTLTPADYRERFRLRPH